MSKNTIHQSGSVVFVECSNVTPSVYFTSSVDLLPVLESHRWRVINGEVVTTTWKLDYEVKTKAVHLLTGKDSSTPLYCRNRNPFDLRLENWTSAHKTPLNKHWIDNGVGNIQLKDGLVITVDITDLPFVAQYNWHTSRVNGRTSVIAYQPTSKSNSYNKLFLPRYLLGVTDTTKQILFRDGDVTNFQRDNLVIAEKRLNHKVG